MSTPPSRPVSRAPVTAEPRLLEIAHVELLPHIRAAIEEAAETYAEANDIGTDAVVAAFAVLLESGMLTDQIARYAAVRYEVAAQQRGISAQRSHVEIADLLGMTRQGIESRLELVGSRPARRGGPSASELREQVAAGAGATPASGSDRPSPPA